MLTCFCSCFSVFLLGLLMLCTCRYVIRLLSDVRVSLSLSFLCLPCVNYFFLLVTLAYFSVISRGFVCFCYYLSVFLWGLLMLCTSWYVTWLLSGVTFPSLCWLSCINYISFFIMTLVIFCVKKQVLPRFYSCRSVYLWCLSKLCTYCYVIWLLSCLTFLSLCWLSCVNYLFLIMIYFIFFVNKLVLTCFCSCLSV